MRQTIGLLVVIALVFSIYCTFFVTTPSDVVEKFFNSIDNADLNSAITCVDPKYEKAFNAASTLLNPILGFSGKDAADLMPALFGSDPSFKPNGNSRYNVEIISSKIEGQKMNEFLNKVSKYGPGKEVGNLLGETAFVTAKYNDKTGDRIERIIKLKKFDEGWRIIDQ